MYDVDEFPNVQHALACVSLRNPFNEHNKTSLKQRKSLKLQQWSKKKNYMDQNEPPVFCL